MGFMLLTADYAGHEVVDMYNSQGNSGIPGIGGLWDTFINNAFLVVGVWSVLMFIFLIVGVHMILPLAGVKKTVDVYSQRMSVDQRYNRWKRISNFFKKIADISLFRGSETELASYETYVSQLGMKLYEGVPWTAASLVAAVRLMMFGGILLTLLGMFLLGVTPIFSVVGLLTVVASLCVPTMLSSRLLKVSKDIDKDFYGFYLLVYHSMLEGGNVESLIRMYNHRAKGGMELFTTQFLYYIGTYGDTVGCDKLGAIFTHPYLSRFITMYRGFVRGADVRSDAIGFEQQLADAEERRIEDFALKLEEKAHIAFYVLMPVLIQAIISAMGIFLSDIFESNAFW